MIEASILTLSGSAAQWRQGTGGKSDLSLIVLHFSAPESAKPGCPEPLIRDR